MEPRLDEAEQIESARQKERDDKSVFSAFGVGGIDYELSELDIEIQKLDSWKEGLIRIAEIRNNLGDYSGAASSEMKVRAIIWALQQLTKPGRRDFSTTELRISMIEYDTYFRSGDIPRAIIALDYQLEALNNSEKFMPNSTMGQRKYVELDRNNLIKEYETSSYRTHPTFDPTIEKFPAIALYCSVEYVLETARVIAGKGENIFPLHTFSQLSRFELMDGLIEQGYDIAEVDSDGFTAIHSVAGHGDAGVIKVLIEYGLNVDQVTESGWTPLMLAAQTGNTEVVEALIDAGSEVSYKGENDWTPLHIAEHYKHEEITGLLTDAGADISAKDSDGRVPSEMAQTVDSEG